MNYQAFIPVTIPASDGSEKVCSVNLQRVIFVEPVIADADAGTATRQTVAGYVPFARTLLWLNVSGEIIAVKETRDEIQEASEQVARMARGSSMFSRFWWRTKNAIRWIYASEAKRAATSVG